MDHVLEQRVTTIGVSLLMGLFAFGGSYLRLPLASLFGVFLYLGVMNLTGVQFIQRIILFFIPEKYFPNTTYTESVIICAIFFNLILIKFSASKIYTKNFFSIIFYYIFVINLNLLNFFFTG